MEIFVPKSIGVIESTGLRPEGPNVVFAADNHHSFQASRNITRCYLRLADKYSLRKVSFESDPLGQKWDSSSAAPDYLQKSLRDGLKTVGGTLPAFSGLAWYYGREFSDEELTSYQTTIPITAAVMGNEIEFVAAVKNQDLMRLQIHSLKSVSINRLTTYLDDLGVIEEQVKAFNEVVEGVSTLEARFLESFPDEEMDSLYEEASKSLDGRFVERVAEMVKYMRTEDQLKLLSESMDGDDLALMVCGGAHADDFVETAKRLKIGYAIFTPYGINTTHPLAIRRYTRFIRESYFGPSSEI